MYLVDGISKDEVRYKSVHDNTVTATDRTAQDLARWVKLPFTPARSLHHQTLPIERIGAEDGRTLLAFMRGDPVPATPADPQEEADATEEVGGDTSPEGVLSLREFEHQTSTAGVGSAYRDVIYLLLEMGHRAEVSDAGMRVVTASEPNRVLLTASLRSDSALVVTILPGAFPGENDQTKVVRVVKPGEAADEVLQLLRSLTGAEQRPPPG